MDDLTLKVKWTKIKVCHETKFALQFPLYFTSNKLCFCFNFFVLNRFRCFPFWHFCIFFSFVYRSESLCFCSESLTRETLLARKILLQLTSLPYFPLFPKTRMKFWSKGWWEFFQGNLAAFPSHEHILHYLFRKSYLHRDMKASIFPSHDINYAT